jgi:CIC family chloride channel protein
MSAILDRFEQLQAEELPVVDENGQILGVVTELYVQRRHAEESDKALRLLLRE